MYIRLMISIPWVKNPASSRTTFHLRETCVIELWRYSRIGIAVKSLYIWFSCGAFANKNIYVFFIVVMYLWTWYAVSVFYAIDEKYIFPCFEHIDCSQSDHLRDLIIGGVAPCALPLLSTLTPIRGLLFYNASTYLVVGTYSPRRDFLNDLTGEFYPARCNDCCWSCRAYPKVQAWL